MCFTRLLSGTGTGGCASGWYNYNSSCYYISSTKVTYANAIVACVAMGANLTSISNSAENNFITNEILSL